MRVAQCEWRSASRALGVRVPDPCQSLRVLRVDACISGSEVAAKGDDKGKRTGKGGNAGRGSARLQGSLEVSPRLKPKPQTLNPGFTLSPKSFHTRKPYPYQKKLSILVNSINLGLHFLPEIVPLLRLSTSVVCYDVWVWVRVAETVCVLCCVRACC